MKPVVLQLIDSFNEGGSERQALQLTRLLHDSGRFQVHLASLSPDGVLRSELDGLNLGDVPSFPLSSFYDPNAFRQMKRFVSFLKSSKVEILQTHDFYTNVFGMLAGKLARVPVRIASMRETAGMRTATQLRAQGLAYSCAQHVIANSLAVREKLIQSNVGAEKITVIYNGLDTSRLATRLGRAETILALGLAPDTDGRMFVTILANMRHEVKDYPLFLRAAQRVKEAIPGAMFLLAGEGELAESLRGLAADLGIADSTIFLGRCDKVAELLSISDVCVLSSKAEGFSNSILEYMAAGCPVVATDVGGAREVIREGLTGYLVQSGDNQTMADRIISLLREPENAREMGQRGRQIVEQTFSTAAQLRAVEGLYEKLLNTRTTRIIAPSLPAENSAISREH